jgi:hypothetical protein
MILVMLISWVLFSPVAIAAGGCVGMWAMCESPCTLSSCALPTSMPPVVPQAVAYCFVEPKPYLPTPVIKALKPPPKFYFFPVSFSTIA